MHILYETYQYFTDSNNPHTIRQNLLPIHTTITSYYFKTKKINLLHDF